VFCNAGAKVLLLLRSEPLFFFQITPNARIDKQKKGESRVRGVCCAAASLNDRKL
jgi:hypothetical protein